MGSQADSSVLSDELTYFYMIVRMKFLWKRRHFFFTLIFQYSNMHEHRAVSQLLEGLGARRLSHHYSMHEVCEVASIGNLQMLRHMVHNGATVCYRDFNKRTPL